MVFPRWTNFLPAICIIVLAGGGIFSVFVCWYWFTDKNLVVGYQPEQPVKYSHKLHVNDLGMDCRFCHFNVERSPIAGVPSSGVCMNCHERILPDSPEIIRLKRYHDTGRPVPWTRVYKLPEYAYFDHSVHVNKGVACVECHGRVDQMETVRHAQSLTMSWCLDCHNAPEERLRDRKLVTMSSWTPEGDRSAYGREFFDKYNIRTRIDCSTCHR